MHTRCLIGGIGRWTSQRASWDRHRQTVSVLPLSPSGLVSGSGGVKHPRGPPSKPHHQGPRPPLIPAPSHVLNPLSFELGKALLIHALASANCFSNASRTPCENDY